MSCEDKRPVNFAKLLQNQIRAYDTGSDITIHTFNADMTPADMQDKVELVVLTADDEAYIEVEDYVESDRGLTFKLPMTEQGKLVYRVEIRTTDGEIYPADRDVFIRVKPSVDDMLHVEYLNYREHLVEETQRVVREYLLENPEDYTGIKTHEVVRQDVASSEWIIEHTLDRYPAVSCVNATREEIFGDVNYISKSKISIKFSGAVSGKALLN